MPPENTPVCFAFTTIVRWIWFVILSQRCCSMGKVSGISGLFCFIKKTSQKGYAATPSRRKCTSRKVAQVKEELKKPLGSPKLILHFQPLLFVGGSWPLAGSLTLWA